ncbi:hypothetical protein [Aeromicrobium sp. Root472D3]|uniref:hypothetical protein n=1 Tax=Aeromicrobium sp. Root472D3 TaxID=1736540 RepID=UPI000A8D2800|nr:hypothetical protein [Aeromicrobium sp. Root472D3]
MRTWWGWALSVLGVLLAAAGAAVMVVLGPDSRLSTGPHAIETDDIAVVTAPEVIRWADVKIDVRAELPARKPVFIGLGNTVDVRSYLAETRRLEVTSFDRPWTITTRAVDGAPALPGAPTALDWWIATSEPRLGGATLSARLPDESVSLAILSVGSSNLAGLEVTLAYGVNNGFLKGASTSLLGLAVLWVGVLAIRSRRRDEPDGDDLGDDLEEEVVYVYVDDDGVEHEISAEEAADLEVVDEIGADDDPPRPAPGADTEPEPEPEPEPVPTVPQVVVPGVLTAADIAAGRDRPRPAPDPHPEPERVVYVFVDEDGVEHEVGEDELAEFEVVDDETDDGGGRP